MMSASCGPPKTIELATRRPVDLRLEESGLNYSFNDLRIKGCEGEKVTVKLYVKNDSGAEIFLAQKEVAVTNNDEDRIEINLFVPLSRLADFQSRRSNRYMLYVQSPKLVSDYLGKVDFVENDEIPSSTGFVWSSREWADETTLPTGDTVFQIKASLEAQKRYFKDSVESIVMLEDANGNIFKSPGGDPLIISGQKLLCPDDRFHDDNLIFNIPYNQLAHLWAGQPIFARPGVRLESGELIGGNLYIEFWAGGSLDTISKRYENENSKLSQEINVLELRENVLGSDR